MKKLIIPLLVLFIACSEPDKPKEELKIKVFYNNSDIEIINVYARIDDLYVSRDKNIACLRDWNNGTIACYVRRYEIL